MKPITRMLLSAAAVVLVQACAGGGSSAGTAPAPSANNRSSRSLITKDELDANHFDNAYEAVETLRSNWLQARGLENSNTGATMLVYLNDTRLGDLSDLKTIPIRQVYSIRHLTGIEATARYGVEHTAGAVMVSTLIPNRVLSDSAALQRSPN
jgi:hypothetical protein